MPTEDFDEVQARSLLARAAATIDVDETTPMTLTGLPQPRPSVAGTGRRRCGRGSRSAGGTWFPNSSATIPSPHLPADQTEAADREPVEQEYVYADDEMPSLLGYTTEEATELLESRGYPLRVEAEHSCDQPAGYVLGTDPGPGTPMVPGDKVQVRVTGGPAPNVRCAAPANTWQQVLDLARFARGLGGAAFPGPVSIAVGEAEYVDLTAAEAADPANWVLCEDGECHSALAALAQILTTPQEMDDFYAQTFLVVTEPAQQRQWTGSRVSDQDPHA